MDKFEVGKSYRWLEIGFDPFTVLRRTEKTITVTNGPSTWRMLVRIDDDGVEYVRDSSMRAWGCMFKSKASWLAR